MLFYESEMNANQDSFSFVVEVKRIGILNEIEK